MNVVSASADTPPKIMSKSKTNPFGLTIRTVSTFGCNPNPHQESQWREDYLFDQVLCRFSQCWRYSCSITVLEQSVLATSLLLLSQGQPTSTKGHLGWSPLQTLCQSVLGQDTDPWTSPDTASSHYELIWMVKATGWVDELCRVDWRIISSPFTILTATLCSIYSFTPNKNSWVDEDNLEGVFISFSSIHPL